MARRKAPKLFTFNVWIDDDCEPTGQRVIYTFSAAETTFRVPEADRDWLLREAGWDETCRCEPTLYVRPAQ